MPFEKDLGYLSQFFKKLEDHAETLPKHAQMTLHTFVAEQRTRWQTLQETVLAADETDEAPEQHGPASTEPPPTTTVPETPTSTATALSARDDDPARMPAPRLAANAQPAPPPPRHARGAQLTVGSLIPSANQRS